MPMIWVSEVAKEIAEQLNVGKYGVIGDIVGNLTDRNDLIIWTEVPDEESLINDYDIETCMFFKIVMRELHLDHGDKFLVYTD